MKFAFAIAVSYFYNIMNNINVSCVEGTLIKRTQSRVTENAHGLHFWGIITVSLVDSGEEIKIKGTSPILGEIGDYVQASGRYEETNWGRQFAADTLFIDLPRGEVACTHRLEELADAVPGLGAKTIRAMYTEVGDEIWTVLKEGQDGNMIAGARLLPELRERFEEHMKQRGVSAANEEALIIAVQRFLSGLRLGHSWNKTQIANTVAMFGNKVMDVIQGQGQEQGIDIIELLKVPGIGYKTVRDLADALELSGLVKARIVVIGNLIECEKQGGHVCYPIDEFVMRFQRFTTDVNVEDAINSLKLDGLVDVYDGFLYQSSRLEQEVFISNRLVEMGSGEGDGDDGDDEGEGDEGEESCSPEQWRAYLSATHKRLSIINGGAGTGKTSLLAKVIAHEESMGHEYRLLAPTGKAAQRMADVIKGHESSMIMTIHRFLAIQNATDHPDKIDSIDLLVVDEMSMVDNDLFYRLLVCLGGLGGQGRLVLLGDYNQLPSVGAGQLLMELVHSGLKPITLTTVFRQSAESAGLAAALESILDGRVPTSNKEEGFTWMATDDLDKIESALKARAVAYADQLDKIWIMTPMNLNVDKYNTIIRKCVNPATLERVGGKGGGVVLQAGDRVMQMVNNYKLKVYNGTIGVIKSVEVRPIRRKGVAGTKRIVKVAFEGMSGDVEYMDDEAYRELKLAYATTCHKAQGSEVDYGVLVLPAGPCGMVDRRLLYTAISRAKKKCLLIGSRGAVAEAVGRKGAMRHSCLKAMIQKKLTVSDI